MLESLPGTGRGTGATLIGARMAGVRVTPISGFSAWVGAVRRGSEYCGCGPEFTGSAVGGGGGGGGGGAGGSSGALTLGSTLFGAGGAPAGAGSAVGDSVVD